MKDQIKYVFYLIKLAYNYSKLVILCPFFSCIAAFSELIAMVVIVPLSELATSGTLSSNDPIVKIFHFFKVSPTLVNLFGCMIFFLFFRLLALAVNQGFTIFLSKKFHAYISASSFSNILKHVPLCEVRKKSIGHYMSLAGDEAFRVSEILVSINKLFTIILLGSLYFLAIVYLSPMFSIYLLFFLLLSAGLMAGAFKLSAKLGSLKFDQSRKANSIFIDGLNSLASIRSFSAENYITNSYSNNINDYTKTLFKIDYVNILIKFIPVAAILFIFSCVLFTPYANLIEKSNINFTLLITLTMFVMRFLPVIGQLINIFIQVISDSRASLNISEVLAINKFIDDKHLLTIENGIQSIIFENVSYSYNDKNFVIRNFNYIFKKGKSYALIGQSGIGKSTLLKLLIRLMPLTSGDIKLNNISINKLSLYLLRNKVIYLEQDPIILNDTIKNNLLFGEEKTENQIQTATELAQCNEFISLFVDKHDHKINYLGSNISGGQKQRIGLARAILRSPDVLLLDESTSALDSNTKDLVIKNILSLYKDKIVIFVSHDNNIKKYVDEIIDFDKIFDLDAKYNLPISSIV